MVKSNFSESGYAHLLLIVAVLVVMGLMAFSNFQLTDQFSTSNREVLGVSTANKTNNLEQNQDPLGFFIQQVIKLIPKF